MDLPCLMHDTQRHRCTRCEQIGRGVDWQPLLGEFMHYECWLELATEVIRSTRVPEKSRAQRIGELLSEFSCVDDPLQRELF